MYRLNRPYVRDNKRNFTPVYLPGETYSFYFNPDNGLTDTNYASFHLYLLNSVGTQVVDLGLISTVFLNPVTYHIYKTFVFPAVKDGQYFFQVYDAATSNEKYRSNVILVHFDCVDRTCILKFRHNDNIYNTYYNLLPAYFYQIFRLPLSQTDLQFMSDRTQYREASNGRNLRNTKSFRDQKITIEAYWFDDESHQALSAALEQSDVHIDGYKIINIKQITVERQTPFSNLTKSNFEILLDEYNVDPLDPDSYEIIYGGCAPSFICGDWDAGGGT